MAMSLCMVLSGSLGTPLSSCKGATWVVTAHRVKPRSRLDVSFDISPDYHARLLSKTRQTWLNITSLLVLTSSSRIKPSVTNSWLWLQIFGWLTWALLQIPTHGLSFYLSRAASWHWKLLSVLEGRSRKSFLPDFWRPLVMISSSPVHSQTIRCVFPSSVISAHSGCSWRHIQTKHKPGILWAHAQRLGCACALFPHQWGLSDSPCTGNTMTDSLQQPIPRLHKAQTQGLPVQAALASSI